MTLRRGLKPYITGLRDEQKAIAMRAVAHFVFFNDYKVYRELIRGLEKSNYDKFYKEVRDFLRSSYDREKVWRAAYYSIKYSESLAKSCRRFGVSRKDVVFLWKALSKNDKLDVKERAHWQEGFALLTQEQMCELTQKLERHCRNVAKYRLRFVSDNDQGLTIEDLQYDLLAHGLQVARRYEHTGDLKYIENHAKKGISHYAINLIQYYTSDSRRCVENVTKGCRTCIFCLTDKPQKCPHSVADYKVTTMSLEVPAIQTTVSGMRARTNSEAFTNQQSFVSFMEEGLEEPALCMLRLILEGDSEDAFDDWLRKNKNVTVDDLLEKPRKLIKATAEYLDVSHKDLVNELKKRYAQYRTQNISA